MNQPIIDWSKLPILISVISLIIAFLAFYISHKADTRSEKLYIGQRIAEIHIIPINVEEYIYDDQVMGRITLQITNYTGFNALNMKLDAKFENQWIGEWVKAAAKGLSEKETKGQLNDKLRFELKNYQAASAPNILNLEPNQSVIHVMQGGLNFDRAKQKMITLRASWTSENGARFDKIFQYELISTSA